ncbi:MAG: Spy/CpxP family protein refolding chaperone [Campylobacteraceae bacterium]|nr:Spy/CpxP family protein refolding chaperone [Campylobacteraceae bacterium]
MKKTILAVATIVALSSSAFAFGGGMNCQGGQSGMGQGMMMQGGGMGQGMMGRHGGMQMLQSLNLTDDQRHKLSILQSEMKLEMTKLQDPKMMSKMQDFMTGESFNKKEFLKLTGENQAKMNTLKADHMEKVFNLLTKEQRAELKANMAKRPMPMMGKQS